MRAPAVALFLACGSAAAADWTPGASVRLRITVLEAPVHDGAAGRSRLDLETPDGKQVAERDLDGVWRCVAWARDAKRFVLAGAFEVGAWLPVVEVRYLDEHGALTPSRALPEGWLAMAAVPSASGRWVAWVGTSDAKRGFALMALDTLDDKLTVLGKPPAPPPGAALADGAAWDWGDPVDGFVELDAGILTFDGDRALIASYGRDSAKKRGAPRTQRRFGLSTAHQ